MIKRNVYEEGIKCCVRASGSERCTESVFITVSLSREVRRVGGDKRRGSGRSRTKPSQLEPAAAGAISQRIDYFDPRSP